MYSWYYMVKGDNNTVTFQKNTREDEKVGLNTNKIRMLGVKRMTKLI